MCDVILADGTVAFGCTWEATREGLLKLILRSIIRDRIEFKYEVPHDCIC